MSLWELSKKGMYDRERRKRLLEKGLCIRCSKEQHLPGINSCAKCKEKTNLHQSNLRKERRANGLCVRCGTKTTNGKYYCDKHTKEVREFNNQYRQIVLDNYGRKCVCCGESREEFLAIDHTNGGGSKHRKETKLTAGYTFYLWLIRNNFPSDYQVLCHNCNQAKGYYGYCPHEKERINP